MNEISESVQKNLCHGYDLICVGQSLHEGCLGKKAVGRFVVLSAVVVAAVELIFSVAGAIIFVTLASLSLFQVNRLNQLARGCTIASIKNAVTIVDAPIAAVVHPTFLPLSMVTALVGMFAF